jgi:hypothetical protein
VSIGFLPRVLAQKQKFTSFGSNPQWRLVCDARGYLPAKNQLHATAQMPITATAAALALATFVAFSGNQRLNFTRIV